MDCSNLKIGDRVWSGQFDYPRVGIKTVIRITPALVILDKEGPFNRYYKRNGSQVSGGTCADCISAVATPKECLDWDKEHADAREAKAAAEQEAARTESERCKLAELFPESVHVGKEAWRCDGDESLGKWSVSLHFLTPAQVESLRDALTPELIEALKFSEQKRVEDQRRWDERIAAVSRRVKI